MSCCTVSSRIHCPPSHLHRAFGALATGAVLCLAGTAHAQYSGDEVRIGFITDMTGLLSDTDGPGGVEAMRMAVADFGGTVNGKKIEVLSADHQNKADIASTTARAWIDREGVDMLIAGTNSSAALSVSKIAADKKTPLFVIAAGSSRLTNEECSPFTIHYAYDTVSTSRVMGSEIVKLGGKDWYFLTADYAFGKSLEADASAVVKKLGGTVVGPAAFRSQLRISLHSCSRRRRPKPRSSPSRRPVTTPRTRSRQPMNSA